MKLHVTIEISQEELREAIQASATTQAVITPVEVVPPELEPVEEELPAAPEPVAKRKKAKKKEEVVEPTLSDPTVKEKVPYQVATYEEAMAVVKPAMAKYHLGVVEAREIMTKVLKKFGAEKVADLPINKYSDFVTEAMNELAA